ncbi:hypothetical protein GQ53DRAFT_761037 [Thozetella sp. PMI_491]|nr:hypothetical protein GQ53DRAFT_761037 [Thozetella sp. PMI_491]
MATATTLLPVAVPGLHSVLNTAELEAATTLYNVLHPNDDNLPKTPDHIRAGAQQLIEKFGITSKFCFHLLHGHDKLEKGTIMVPITSTWQTDALETEDYGSATESGIIKVLFALVRSLWKAVKELDDK